MEIRMLNFRPVSLVMFLCLAASTLHAQSEKTLDRIIAVIGNEIITESEMQLQVIQAGMKNRTDASSPAVKKRILDAMINDKLILAQAVLDSINITEDEVSRRLESQIDYLKRTYGSVERLEKEAGMTISQMKRDFREDIRKRLMIDQIQSARFGEISVNQREVNEFFTTFKDSLPPVPEQIEVRQIVMYPKVTDQLKAAARSKAQLLLDSLCSGVDFSELAKRHSDDVGSANNGGRLGLARRGLFVRDFEEAAFALKPGEVSNLVETQFGFHIIKLIDKKGDAIEPQHILIRVEKSGASDSVAIRALADLRKRALAGEDFATLAKQYSEDEETKKLGGSMGLVEVPQLSDDMKSIQQKLNVGDISEPSKLTFEKDYGYTIVLLSKRIPTHPAGILDDYVRIANYAKIYKQNNEYMKWIDEIKKNVYWKVML
jgi:peptidyl-prolyl cis-trans isomerase SurA